MNYKSGIRAFGLIEILIGAFTLQTLLLSLLESRTDKPPAVFIFVLTTALLSTILGLGILKSNLTSLRLLLYFSSVIIISKLLIFSRIITLSGALETAIPAPIKNTVSVFYHGLVLFYFMQPQVLKHFKK